MNASTPVQVFRHRVTGALYLGNVQTCGRWYCPVCGPRIRVRRAAETVRMAGAAEEHGYELLRVGWTYGHAPGDSFTGLLARQREAFRLGSNGSSALSQRFKRAGIEYVGSRRALDYMYGQSGHHPHEHGVLIVEPGQVPDVTDLLKEHWRSVTARADLDTSGAAVKVETVDAAGAGYLFKSGQRPDKLGQTSRTHFQLLRDAAAGDDHAGQMWREVALGVQGVRLVSTTPGLKLLGVLTADSADEQLARPTANPDELIAVLPDWRGMDADTWESLTTPALGLAAD